MKKSILLIACVAFSMATTAKQRTFAEMRNIAVRLLDNNDIKRVKASSNTDKYNLKRLHVNTEFTVVGYDNAGFVVIANDDNIDPVLGFSTSTFDANNMPDGMKWWMNAMEQSLAYGSNPENHAIMKRAKKVDPLLKTQWGQGAPYNNFCPKDCPTGCVATALAQTFYARQYPTTGEGEIFDADTFDFISYGNTTYDYANMLPTYEAGKYNQTQGDAVATLMYHIGRAINMNYAPGGSGTTLLMAMPGLKEHFRINKNVATRYRMFHAEEWMDYIYDELDNQRPVVYCGADKATGGHCFVVDGYNEQGLVHLDWGWDGVANGWFDVNKLNPSAEGTDYSYTEEQNIFTGLAKTTEDVEHTTEIVSTLPLELSYSNGTFTIGKYIVYNYNDYKFDGSCHLVIDNGKELSSILNISFDKDRAITAAGKKIYGSGINGGTFEMPDGVKDGTYLLYFVAQDSGKELVNRVYPAEGVNWCYTLTKKGNNITLTEGGTTGIASVTAKPNKVSNAVYSIDGRVMGNDINAMGKGLYIVDGKKVMK